MNQKRQLQELVRHIVRQTLKELMNTGASSFQGMSADKQQAMVGDPTMPPMDAMTPIEKAQQEREQEKQRKDALKQGEAELKSAKKEMDFQKQKIDQSKRFKIPTLTKRLQQLKGGLGGI